MVFDLVAYSTSSSKSSVLGQPTNPSRATQTPRASESSFAYYCNALANSSLVYLTFLLLAILWVDKSQTKSQNDLINRCHALHTLLKEFVDKKRKPILCSLASGKAYSYVYSSIIPINYLTNLEVRKARSEQAEGR